MAASPVQFGKAAIQQFYPGGWVRDRLTGTMMQVNRMEAIEGGRLVDTGNKNPDGSPVLAVANTNLPVYFNVQGRSLNRYGMNEQVSLIVPFTNLGPEAETYQLDIVV